MTTAETSKLKNFDDKVRVKYESFWLYSPTHPWRLGEHIFLRGILGGGTLAVLGGVPYAMIRKPKGQVLSSIGRIALRGTVIGGVLMGVAAAERCYRLPAEGVEDRAYRIAHNWSQTKWDYLGLEGAILGGAFLRRPFGGVLPAAAVGMTLGSFAYFASSMLLMKL